MCFMLNDFNEFHSTNQVFSLDIHTYITLVVVENNIIFYGHQQFIPNIRSMCRQRGDKIPITEHDRNKQTW